MKSVVVTQAVETGSKRYYAGAAVVTDAEATFLDNANLLTGAPQDWVAPTDADAAEHVANRSTDIDADFDSDIKYPSVKAVTDYLNAVVPSSLDIQNIASLGRKNYRDFISQTGAFAPSSTMDTNDDAAAPSWSRVGVGIYRLTITGAFTNLKTFCVACLPDFNAAAPFAWYTRVDANIVEIRTGIDKSTLVELEGLLYLEIQVNP